MATIGGKRIRNGEVEYLSGKSWKKAAEFNGECINLYECSTSKHIIGYRNQNNKIEYLVKGFKVHDTKIIFSDVLQQHRPELIIDFLEEHLEWKKSTNVTIIENADSIEMVRPGPIRPEQIIYATNVTNELTYFVQFQDGRLKYIDAKRCRAKWPELIIEYFEKFLK